VSNIIISTLLNLRINDHARERFIQATNKDVLPATFQAAA
jgi:hypothetical protein